MNEELLQIDLVSFCIIGLGLMVNVLLVAEVVPHSFLTSNLIE